MFMLQKKFNVKGSVTVPDNTIGENGDVGLNSATGDIYVKQAGAWVLYTAASPAGYSGPITVENSAGSVTRSLTATNGVVNLAATDAIVANGASIVLHNNAGTVSSGNAGLNSPAVAEVAAGVITDVKAAA